MRPGNKALLIGLVTILIIVGILGVAREAFAQPLPLPEMELRLGGGEGDPEGLVGFLQLLLFLAILSLAPAFIVLMTSFARIVIVLSFVRSALATHQIPPSQVLIGLALFMTIFVMYPTWEQVNEQAVQPYLEGEITQEEAWAEAKVPMADFMFYQTREKDLALFINISGMELPEDKHDVPMHVLVPSFVISELKTAFQMGFILFIPFLIIDMVVASTLMSMGMFMLPPVIVSLPFKILLFVLVDGWHLVVKSLLESFR
ncbi:MAG TPA: flagellar type III secretion system pore protein FliP [Firmicutes bacterium]|nr:flagellar type III secretion system pore protein FliP [Bacillota bacterium]